jgi:hypothetical protein
MSKDARHWTKKALTNGFVMTPDQTLVFIKAFSCRAIVMGWTKGTKQITTFTNSAVTQINLIKYYSQINKATLKTVCERFYKAGEVDAQIGAKQTNTMMAICLASPLMAEAQARLLTYCNKYTFNVALRMASIAHSPNRSATIL